MCWLALFRIKMRELSELWAEVVEGDSVLDLASHDFAVMEELTRTTQPAMKLL
jgi:hypothetical protein